MKNLFIFLLIALISTYSIKLKDKSKIWIIAIVIPFFSLIVFGVIISIVKSAYFAGHEIGMSLIPAIISGIVIYFQIKKKIKSENIVKFPILLVIFIGISLIGSIAQYALETKNRIFIQEYSKNKDILKLDTNSTKNETNDKSQLLNLDFNGVSFSYLNGWKVETKVLQENLGFQVSCEKTGLSSDMISIVWLRGTNFSTIREMAENTIEGINEEMSAYNAKANKGNLYYCTFIGKDAVALDYTMTLFGEIIYGKIISFIMNGNTVVVTKQSDTKDKLNTNFKLIEKSFNLKKFTPR
ncbi:hypothetical protein [Acetobacteroides hydrogenigenes]|uniref:Uncharacterized protein n=1 Tax=Acetobacteroides hydrogenigenes TaxID=979970 RepID=A0A4R2EQI4_9BACT|nr:hypothetical protein [Acetobacteroides hydrogenigenes]TCN68884.1 hypothetical protein CLV25_10586 [Acetobacteroides hydrogenigenes]